jgi:hypothetical protein
MRPAKRLGTTLLVPQCLVVLAILTGSALPAQVVVGPAVCVPKIIPPPGTIRLTPWIYAADSGDYVWGEHRFYEDPGDTVFSLAREMVSLGAQQPGIYPDVLLFNVAQFDPPEGIPAGGPRRLMTASIEDKGLQLFVNYTNALIDPAQSVRYGQIGGAPGKPVFFQSIDGAHQNEQTIPPVPWSGFSPVFVSATRGAFGCALTPVQPHKEVPLASIAGTSFAAAPVVAVPLTCQDLYVTAGLPYGLAELDPDPAQQVLAAQAQTDLLLHRDPATGRWHDIAQDPCPGGPRIPVSATAGNSSGVVFADLTGDGWADLYIGKQGDGYLGEKNVLLVNDGTGCFQDQTAARIPGELVRATNEVAAIKLDDDDDLDLVVADRCRRDGTCGAESEDYALINDGTGHFTVVPLAPGVFTDSRSVALGDLNHDGWPEIVLGNAGSDGFSNNLALSSAEDHRMQIFVNNVVLNGTKNQFTDFLVPILEPPSPPPPPQTYLTEHEVTAPLTQQVLLVDLFHPSQPFPPPGAPPLPGSLNTPDGWLDLVIVSQRDILKNDTFFAPSSRVYVLANMANWSGAPPFLGSFTAFALDWVRTAAVADFDGNGFKDLFLGRGNRFSGATADVESSLGDQAPGRLPWENFAEFKSYETMPGNEHGYGFDFADVDGDGALDALQASRGYNYLVRSILGPVETEHADFVTAGLGGGQSDNRRGRLIPHGMEDGVFADFDRDGDVDALLASQRTPSATWPFCASVTPDSIVLVNDGSGHFGYDTAPAAVAPCAVEDARVDVGQRTAEPLPGIADRAVAGDLDNDGDVDAIVHLFELHPDPDHIPFEPVLPVLGQPGTPFSQPVPDYAFGWRYLQNVIGEAGAGITWFRDVAPARMRNAAGAFDPNWNRGLGMDLLADFDNNGGLDLYTTVGFAKQLNAQVQQVTNIEQTDDLLFLNGVGGTAKGILTESAAAVLPARCLDQVKDTPGDFDYASCGSFGIAQGDIDGDGDADVVVAHYGQSGRTNYPWLLINLLNDQGSSVLAFQDQLQSRVPVGSLSPVIHTADATVGGVVKHGMDYAMFPALADLDADGDLDLFYQVVNDLPRVLLNVGKDSNGDGVINKLDTPPPGTFTDATPAVLQQLKPSTDAQDLAAVDIDRDGDLDLANDPFSDRVTFWRNDLPKIGGLPAVTEIWPRVGSTRRRTVRFEGIHLDNVTKVQFRFAGGAACESTLLTPVGTAGRQLDVLIPSNCPLGLAQVRVQRTTACGPPPATQGWSRQYFGYFILG